MFIRRKGGSFQLVKSEFGRQRVVLHLGTMASLCEAVRVAKALKRHNPAMYEFYWKAAEVGEK